MFEAFSVGIRLRLLDSVSAGLIGMAGQFAAFNRHVNQSQAQLTALQAKLSQIKMMGLLGGAAFGLGAIGLYAFKAPLEEAKAWMQEVAKFQSLGFGSAVNQDAQRFAAGMKTYGTSARENLALLGDAMSVFKDLGHAEIAAPILAKMKFANEAVFGASGGANERQFMDMLKVIELRRGLSSTEEFATQADFVQKAISGSRGRVNASQWLALLKTGGVGVSQMRNEAFYLGLEPLVQEFGGSRLGTSLMSVYQNLIQGRGTITAQQELYRLGLLDRSKVQFNSMGMLKKALPGAFTGGDVFETEGPLALLEKVLIPAFQSKGITTEPQILNELSRILGNRTASNVMARAYQQRASIAMQSEANRNAQGINALVTTGMQTPEGKMIELHAKWRDVLRDLGLVVLPVAIKAVESLTAVIKTMDSLAREFPVLTKVLVVSFGILAGLTLAGGAVTLITAGFKALGLALTLGGGWSGLLRLASDISSVGTAAASTAAAVGGTAGLGARLLAVAGSVGTVAAGLSAAAAGGYLFGKVLNSLGPNGDLGGWIGGWLYEHLGPKVDAQGNLAVIHPGYARGAPIAPADHGSTKGHADLRRGSPYVAPAANTTINMNTKLVADGRILAEVVTKHQIAQIGRPQTGASVFDGSQSLVPAGAGF